MKMPKNIWLILILIITITVSANYYLRDTSFYLSGDLSELSEVRQKYLWFTITHFSFAALTLFIGPLQFLPVIRKKFIRLHRSLGKFYIVGSILSALTVFVLLATVYTLPGAIPSLGFLAIIWLYTTVAAYIFIRKGKIERHKEFMLRSYVCGLAFVFIRLLPEVNDATGIFNFIEDETMRRTVYEWICWVYPLMIIEFWIVWRKQLMKA